MIEYIKTHKKQLGMIAVVTVLVLAILFVAMYFSGVFDDRANAIIETIKPTLTVEPSLGLGPEGGGEYWRAEIDGEVQNIIHTTVDVIAFHFHLLDENGQVIMRSDGNPYLAEAFILKLSGGERKAYKASIILNKKPYGFVAIKT